MNKVGIVFGGASSEYEISLLSASSVLKNIDTSKFEVYMIGIKKDGEMFLYNGDIDAVKFDKWHLSNCSPCVISTNRAKRGIIVFDEKDNSKVLPLDIIFPVLHGKNGEDGTFQGMLAIAGIPYVGSNALASACCMDKDVTHALLDSAGVPVSKWLVATTVSYQKNKAGFLDEVETVLGYPCFVKPANSGSSVGISKAKDRDGLIKAIDRAFLHDKKVIVEELLTGLEVECAVMGNDAPIASCIGEIEPCNEFYDYEAKYLADKTKTYIPARISERDSDTVRALALKAYRVMGCSGLARIDFFLSASGKAVLNELNTIPGFTSISMYAKLFIESGVPYGEIITRLLDYALDAHDSDISCEDWQA